MIIRSFKIFTQLSLLVLLLHKSHVLSVDSEQTKTQDSTFSDCIIDAANFAVEKLRQLSYSDVYQTISLQKIINANVSEGIFHRNILLDVLLSSPIYASGNETERFQILVMDCTNVEKKKDQEVQSEKDKDKSQNGRGDVICKKSFAIDRFPKLDEHVIESWWIRKVQRKQREKKEKFSRFMMVKSNESGSSQRYSFSDTTAYHHRNHRGDNIFSYSNWYQNHDLPQNPQYQWNGVVSQSMLMQESGYSIRQNAESLIRLVATKDGDKTKLLSEEATKEKEEERILKRESLARLVEIINDEENDLLQRKVARRVFDGRVWTLKSIAGLYK